MTNKMAAKDLFYAQGLLSYGDLNGILSKEDRFSFFKADLWRSGFFGCCEEWYYF